MSFPLSDLPIELGGIKELSCAEAVEILVAQAVQGRLPGGNHPGFDVYKSRLFPGQTFQVKFSNTLTRKGVTKVLNGRTRVIKDTLQWAFSVATSEYRADWYVLFGECDSFVYPFLFSRADWVKKSSKAGKGRYMAITAQEYSRCGRYYNSHKRNRKWEHYIREWPDGFLRVIEVFQEMKQAKMDFLSMSDSFVCET